LVIHEESLWNDDFGLSMFDTPALSLPFCTCIALKCVCFTKSSNGS
jgi:hypothetical protein